jgi:hypothetical protein
MRNAQCGHADAMKWPFDVGFQFGFFTSCAFGNSAFGYIFTTKTAVVSKTTTTPSAAPPKPPIAAILS